MYDKEYLKRQVLAAFTADEVGGDLANLIADVLAEYAYLHQIIDVNILMENSFLRSKKLNSRIQQAADRFYSVYRGRNRLIKISNLNVITAAPSIQPFGLISQNAGGKYKLYAADTWNFTPGSSITVTGYLATDMQEVELTGQGKLYLDVASINASGVEINNSNISEDFVVYHIYNSPDQLGQIQQEAEDYTITENGESILYKKVKVYSSLPDFFSQSGTESDALCAITMPNYGVRLFSKTSIPNTEKYLVKYLVCPDPAVEEKDPASSIKNISHCKISNNTTFETLRATEYRLEDPDAIYLYTSNNLKMSGVMKSINSLETIIPECFPEFKSYKMIIGPSSFQPALQSETDDSVIIQDIVSIGDGYAGSGLSSESEERILNYVPAGNIYIWYVLEGQVNLTKNDSEEYERNVYNIPADELSKWASKVKAYYIPENTNIYFRNINELPADSQEPPEHVKVLENYKINIYYKGIVDFQRVRNIIEDFEYQIGIDFNPYQIISALVTDSVLYGKISYVEILVKEGEIYVPAKVVKVAQDQRWWFSDDYTQLVNFKVL